MKRINYSEDFQAFWQAYPRRIDKALAWEAWVRLKPDEKEQKEILESIEKWKETRQWREGYIIYPERFLKRRKWEDDVDSLDTDNSLTI